LANSSSDVLVTDVAAVQAALVRNIELNAAACTARMRAGVLDWLVPAPPSELGVPFDVIVAADVVWVEELIAPLVQALDLLAGPGTVLYLAHQSRAARSDELLFSLLSQRWQWFGPARSSPLRHIIRAQARCRPVRAAARLQVLQDQDISHDTQVIV
jgi:predicted nicotinamide N-methyase